MKSPQIIPPTNQQKQDKSILKKFGKRLAHIRFKKGYSLRHLAAVARLDPSDICKYENGTVNPILTTIARLSRTLGIHPRELIDFEIDWPLFQ
ncbi:MAG TPA: helix-turn-helix transcriptional regulator [Cyclobacteriaceae bacterium]|nr:helix-turn-helix transcriptional regulator [Cyclobacteriaceae bacterium]